MSKGTQTYISDTGQVGTRRISGAYELTIIKDMAFRKVSVKCVDDAGGNVTVKGSLNFGSLPSNDLIVTKSDIVTIENSRNAISGVIIDVPEGSICEVVANQY